MTDTSLFSWKYGEREDGKIGVIDQGTASDADQDIAFALILASQKWEGETYKEDAEKIIRAMWEYEVKQLGDEYYFVAGNWAKDREEVVINPSYLAPYAYKLFSTITPDLPWNAVADSSYDVLWKCSEAALDVDVPIFAPPEWCTIDSKGTIGIPEEESMHQSHYSYNAVRVSWRLAMDYEWTKDPRALEYVQKFDFLRTKYKEDQKLVVGYTHDGQPFENYESVLGYSTALTNFMVTDPELAKEVYEKKILEKFFEDEKQSYWEDPNNYYTNNIAWFATALYFHKLENPFQN